MSTICRTILRLACCAAFPAIFAAPASAQESICDYFTLRWRVNEDGRKSITSLSLQDPGRSLNDFMTAHDVRFDYLLLNRVDSIWTYIKYYPDTAAMRAAFCHAMQNKGVNDAFIHLIPGAGKNPVASFSKAEMMQVASRFFYCDEVDSRSRFGFHICVGIHGQKSLQRHRDFTLLEAFCIEAIFATMETAAGIAADRHFDAVRAQATAEVTKKAVPKNERLAYARQFAFTAMEKDTDLQTALLKHYADNRDNLGFVITN